MNTIPSMVRSQKFRIKNFQTYFQCWRGILQKRGFLTGCSNPRTSTSQRQFLYKINPIISKSRSITTALQERHKTVLLYLSSAAVLACGLSYAAVPLYRLYCQASGYGSAQQEIDFGSKIESMERVEDRILTVRFEAGTSKTLRWKFKPQQKEVNLAPGETALAFYTAVNLTDDPIIGIATYNVIPFEAGQYFNKIQCFCFEEQQLNPGEEVDMPVFFYIDPEFMEDPKLAKYDELILSYTFFQSNEANAPGASPHVARQPPPPPPPSS